MGFPSPSQSVCVAGCVYLLWSEGEDYQAVLRRVTVQHAGSTFSGPLQQQVRCCTAVFRGPGSWPAVTFSSPTWETSGLSQSTVGSASARSTNRLTKHHSALAKRGASPEKRAQGVGSGQLDQPATEIMKYAREPSCMVSGLLGSFSRETHIGLLVLTRPIYFPVSDC